MEYYAGLFGAFLLGDYVKLNGREKSLITQKNRGTIFEKILGGNACEFIQLKSTED